MCSNTTSTLNPQPSRERMKIMSTESSGTRARTSTSRNQIIQNQHHHERCETTRSGNLERQIDRSTDSRDHSLCFGDQRSVACQARSEAPKQANASAMRLRSHKHRTPMKKRSKHSQNQSVALMIDLRLNSEVLG